MSGNQPHNGEGAFGSNGQNDWHEQPTQGPQGQPAQPNAYGQGTSSTQPTGEAQYLSQDQYAQQYSQGSYSSQPQGQPYQANEQYGQQGYQQQPQFGQQQYGAPQYQQPGQYGQQPFGQGPGLGAEHGQLASWGKRVLGYLVDALVTAPIGILMLFFMPRYTMYEDTGQVEQTGGNMAIMWLLNLVLLAIVIWNQGYRQGKTGQSIGKQVVGLKLLSERTGQPVGFGASVLRQIAHIADSVICGVGYLFPLWDAKRQTLADKIMSTLVVDSPKN